MTLEREKNIENYRLFNCFKIFLRIFNLIYLISLFVFSFIGTYFKIDIYNNFPIIFIFSLTVISFILNYIDDFSRREKSNLIVINLCFLIIFVCCLTVLLSSTIVNIPNAPSPLVISESQKMSSFYVSSICGFMPYSILILSRKVFIDKMKILIFMFSFIAFIYFLIIYSLAAEFSKYVFIVKNLFKDMSNPCTANMGKNVFGASLFSGILICILINQSLRIKRVFLLCIPIYIIIPFTDCKTALILSLIVLPIYLIVFNMKSILSNKKRSLLILFSILIAFTVIFCIDFYTNKFLITKFSGLSRTIESRAKIWVCVFNYLKPVEYIFGLGFFRNRLIIYPLCGYNPPCYEFAGHTHNAFVEIISSGGFFLFFVLLFVGAFYIWKNPLKDFKKIFFLIIGTLGAYMFVEPIMLLIGYDWTTFVFNLPMGISLNVVIQVLKSERNLSLSNI